MAKVMRKDSMAAGDDFKPSSTRVAQAASRHSRLGRDGAEGFAFLSDKSCNVIRKLVNVSMHVTLTCCQSLPNKNFMIPNHAWLLVVLLYTVFAAVKQALKHTCVSISTCTYTHLRINIKHIPPEVLR